DPDMAFPEHQIAASQRLVRRDGTPELRLLHIAVARRRDAGPRQRALHEARAIDPERTLAAPEIRDADQRLGDSDEIVGVVARGQEMLRIDEAALARRQAV